MIEPCEAPMVRRIAMSCPLSFTSMIRPGDDVERRDQHDHGQDQEHHVALDLKRVEEGRVALPPVDQEHRPPGGLGHRLAEGIDPVGIGR